MTEAVEALVERMLSRLEGTPISQELADRADHLFARALREQRRTPRTTRAMLVRFARRLLPVGAAVAAALLVVVFLTDGLTSTAWAAVVEAMAQVDSCHFYKLEFRSGRLNNWGQGWFGKGSVSFRKDDGTTFVDDGATEIVYSKIGEELRRGESEFGQLIGQRFSLKFLLRMFSLDEDEYARQKPVVIEDDFLVYRFSAPEKVADWVERVEVSVGKGSHLPFQVKVTRKDQPGEAYDLYILDYSPGARKPDLPRPLEERLGRAEGTLGGEIEVLVPDFPGVHSVVVRPYRKHFEGKGELLVVDGVLVLSDGHRRSFLKQMPLDQRGQQAGGMGDRRWPDGQFRHFRYQIRVQDTGDGKVVVQAGAWLDTPQELQRDEVQRFLERRGLEGRGLGRAEGALGGDIEVLTPDSPGIRSVVVRPYRKRFEGKGEFLVVDAVLVLSDGQRRPFLKQNPVDNEVGIAGTLGDDQWPDGEHRSFDYVLRFEKGPGGTLVFEAGAWFAPLP